ncbi:hypothetical protein LTR36_004150 [Oleoguttula mirabilis]|uniref:Choline monooxygenase, chloroplastic n=1 Tax=Oleoguttula mirabilis TaxID=1507867 RepID=A0AAV9JHB3_9PEZI|nr:hypothetical protein LTR36_004150 [Oleoguttula mirabilis]
MTAIPRTLPASWYRSKALYQLEQRAVFLKAWYLLGPVNKFSSGEPVGYEFSDVSLTVTASETGVKVVNRHVKELRSHITRTGLAFTTISDDAPAFDDFFPGLEDILDRVDFTTRPYRRSIDYEGHFNWKTMVDGYQECLHCQYTHPSFSVLYPPTFYSVINHHNWCQHIADPKKPDDGLFLYFFPNCTLNVYGGGISAFRVCPTNEPGTTRMEFDYYNVDEGEKFEEYYKFVRQVALEDYELCEKAQYNLERGIYAEGVLNPQKENGVAYYQQRVLELVLEQHQKDQQAVRQASKESEFERRDSTARLGSLTVEQVA